MRGSSASLSGLPVFSCSGPGAGDFDMGSPNPLPPPAKFVPEMGKIVRPKAGRVLVKDTGSNRPTIVGDTWVDLEEVPMTDIKVGDPIMFEHSKRGTISAHPVKRIKYFDGRPYFITQGSSNRDEDDIKVTAKEFIGRWRVSPAQQPFDPSSPIQLPAKINVP